MPTVAEVLKAYQKHAETQQALLASIMTAWDPVSQQLETATHALEGTVTSLFPNLDALPLDLMTKAAPGRRLSHKEEVDLRRKTNASILQARNAVVVLAGEDPAAMRTKWNDLESKRAELARDLQKTRNLIGPNRQALLLVLMSLTVLDALEERGVVITDGNIDSYLQANWFKRLINASRRAGYKAAHKYRDLGGTTPTQDRARKLKLENSIRVLENELRAGEERQKALAGEIRSLRRVLDRFDALDRAAESDAAIHRDSVAGIVKLLGNESSAKVFCEGLARQEEAGSVLAQVAKVRELQAAHDGFKDLHRQARQVLDMVTDARDRLKDMPPNRSVSVTLSEVATEPGKFNTSVSTRLGKSQRMRAPTGGREQTPEPSGVGTTGNTGDFDLFFLQALFSPPPSIEPGNGSAGASFRGSSPESAAPATHHDTCSPHITHSSHEGGGGHAHTDHHAHHDHGGDHGSDGGMGGCEITSGLPVRGPRALRRHAPRFMAPGA